MRYLFAAVLAWLVTLAPLWAQDPATPEDIAWINAALERARELIKDGDMDGAYNVIVRANDYTFERDFSGHAEKWLPNFQFAKFYRHDARLNWSEVERFAGSVSVGLDTPQYRDRPERIEAMLLLGEALMESNRRAEAEPILEGALRESLGVWGLERVHIRAAYSLAEVKSLLVRSDAQAARARAFEFYTSGGPILDYEYAFLRYLELDAQRSAPDYRSRLEMITQRAMSFSAYLEGDADIGAGDRSFYRGYIGLALFDNREFEQALALWRERESFLEARAEFGREYFLSGQRIAGAMIALERYDEANQTLQRYIDKATEHAYPEHHIIGLLYRDQGHIASRLGNSALAQLLFRKAYATTRRVRAANDIDVLALRALIDLEDEGIGSFAFAQELGGQSDTPFEMHTDARDVARLFLEGNYIALQFALEDQDLNDPVVLLNRAMASAFLGDYDGMKSLLKAGRAHVQNQVQSGLPANTPFFDLVEVLGTAWGTSHRTHEAEGPIARLAARQDSLSPSERSLFLALALMKDFQEGFEPLVQEGLKRWQAQFDPERAPTHWDVFAMMLVAEIGFTYLPSDEIEPLYAQFTRLLAQRDELVLAREYVEFVRYLNGVGYAESDEGLAAMGALVSTMRPRVPETHMLQASTQFGFANALWTRERYDEAFTAMKSAAEYYQANPYHRNDTLAFLLSQQSLLLVIQGKKELGLAIARETYEEMDFSHARSDLALAVISNYVYALRNFGDNEAAAKIARAHVADRDFMNGLLFNEAVDLLINLGAAEAALGNEDAARRALIEAEAVVPKGLLTAQLALSRVSYQRGWLESWSGNLGLGFEYASQSSRLYHDYRAELARRQTSGEVSQHSEGAFLVSEEARMGWDFAQALQGGNAALSSD